MSQIPLKNCPTIQLFEFQYNNNVLELKYKNQSHMIFEKGNFVDIKSDLNSLSGFPLSNSRDEVFKYLENNFQEGIKLNKVKCTDRLNEIQYLFSVLQSNNSNENINTLALLIQIIESEHAVIEKCLKDSLERLQNQFKIKNDVKNNAILIKKNINKKKVSAAFQSLQDFFDENIENKPHVIEQWKSYFHKVDQNFNKPTFLSDQIDLQNQKTLEKLMPNKEMRISYCLYQSSFKELFFPKRRRIR